MMAIRRVGMLSSYSQLLEPLLCIQSTHDECRMAMLLQLCLYYHLMLLIICHYGLWLPWKFYALAICYLVRIEPFVGKFWRVKILANNH